MELLVPESCVARSTVDTNRTRHIPWRNSDHQTATPKPLTAKNSSDSLCLERVTVVDSSCHKCAEQWPLPALHSIRGSVLHPSSGQTAVRSVLRREKRHIFTNCYSDNRDTNAVTWQNAVPIHYVGHCPLSKAYKLNSVQHNNRTSNVMYV